MSASPDVAAALERARSRHAAGGATWQEAFEVAAEGLDPEQHALLSRAIDIEAAGGPAVHVFIEAQAAARASAVEALGRIAEVTHGDAARTANADPCMAAVTVALLQEAVASMRAESVALDRPLTAAERCVHYERVFAALLPAAAREVSRLLAKAGFQQEGVH